MDTTKDFIKCIDEIENTIKNLSNKINNSNIDWQDGGVEKIKNSISKLAIESNDVIEQSDACWKEIKEFEDYLKN